MVYFDLPLTPSFKRRGVKIGDKKIKPNSVSFKRRDLGV